MLTTSNSDVKANYIAGNVEGKKWNWKKWLSIFALILVLGCLISIIWLVWQLRNYEPFTAKNYYPSLPDSYGVSFIEGNANIKFPPSARDIYVYTTGFQDIFTQVRFSMSADDLDEFVDSTLCQESLRQMEPQQSSTSDETFDWWTPGQSELLIGCTGNNDHSHQIVMIDITNPSVYVVFVSTSTY